MSLLSIPEGWKKIETFYSPRDYPEVSVNSRDIGFNSCAMKHMQDSARCVILYKDQLVWFVPVESDYEGESLKFSKNSSSSKTQTKLRSTKTIEYISKKIRRDTSVITLRFKAEPEASGNGLIIDLNHFTVCQKHKGFAK